MNQKQRKRLIAEILQNGGKGDPAEEVGLDALAMALIIFRKEIFYENYKTSRK